KLNIENNFISDIKATEDESKSYYLFLLPYSLNDIKLRKIIYKKILILAVEKPVVLKYHPREFNEYFNFLVDGKTVIKYEQKLSVEKLYISSKHNNDRIIAVYSS